MRDGSRSFNHGATEPVDLLLGQASTEKVRLDSSKALVKVLECFQHSLGRAMVTSGSLPRCNRRRGLEG